MDATATDRHAERMERIYQAAGVLREDQDEQTRRSSIGSPDGTITPPTAP